MVKINIYMIIIIISYMKMILYNNDKLMVEYMNLMKIYNNIVQLKEMMNIYIY